MTKAQLNYRKWSNHPSDDVFLQKSLAEIKTVNQVNQAFSQQMSFGTAGLRGILGAGTQKMNVRTVGAAAQAYAEYLVSLGPHVAKMGVVIGHDNRHNWKIFTEEVGKIMAFYKIRTYFFPNNDLQPTPLISYAIRKLKAAGGVNITASHNPKEYNGFKVYNSLGGQLMPHETTKISNFMKKIDYFNLNHGLFTPTYIKPTLIEEYINDVLNLQLLPLQEKKIKIVFSPLHGTAHYLGPTILRRMDYSCFTVDSQMTTDPNFTKTKSPNPEDPSAYKKAVTAAKRHRAELVLITDPDADRIGAVVKYKKRYKYLNCNQISALYLHFMFTEMKRNGTLPKNGYIVKSNVSTDLATKIADKFGIKVYETNVGFKNIVDLVAQKPDEKFLFAFEESYGFLLNSDIARDKDAIQGLVAVSEMANYYHNQNSDLYRELLNLYKLFGFHRSVSYSNHLTDPIINRFFIRLLKMKKLGSKNIAKIEDYRHGLHGLDPTNFIKVYFNNGSWFGVRPSGTELKIKYYYDLTGDNSEEIIIFEKRIQDDIEESTEEVDIKRMSRKKIYKFTFFVAVLLAISVTLLYTVYNLGPDTTALSILRRIWELMYTSPNKFWLFMLIFSMVFLWFTSALFTKRAMRSQGYKLSFSRAFISGAVESSISAITPFATGGTLASYWYLRRKNYPRKALLTTFLMKSLLYQVSIALRTFVFIPTGLWIFKDIFFAGTTTANLMLVLVFSGFLFDIFACVMLGLLTTYKRFQIWIVSTAVVLLEWIPFVTISDPFGMSAKYNFEFMSLREGMSDLWSKKWLMLELLFYETINIFYSAYLFAALAVGVNSANLTGGLYWDFITGSNLIRSANNMIPIPGGSGTTEWMSTEIYSKIFNSPSEQYLSAEFTGLVRLWSYIIPTMVSATLLLLVYINERINYRISLENKNKLLLDKKAIVLKNNLKFYLNFIFIPILLIIFIIFIVFLFI